MKRLLKLLPTVTVPALLLCAAMQPRGAKPLYTVDIAVTDDGYVLTADKGSSELSMIDRDGAKQTAWSFERKPTGVIVKGGNAYVTSSYEEGYISKIDLGERSIVYTRPTGMGACAPVANADGSIIYVCNRYKATVSEVDARTGDVLRTAKVLREPCAAALSPDGRYLYVNNFLPAGRADEDYVAAAVSIIDCDNFKKIKDIKLSNGSNALHGIACSPDGRYVFVSHNLGRFQVPTSQLQQGWMNTNAVSAIDAERQELVGSMLMDESDRGAGGIWDVACDGEYLVASHSGTHEISIVDYRAMIERLAAYPAPEKLDYDLYFMRDIRRRMDVAGNGPRKMALKDGKIYLPTYFSDTLNIIDLASREAEIIACNPMREESAADTGERAFNDAAHCYQNWQSCNGCHPSDGRTDGMNWDLMNDGIGNPKNCKSMLYCFQTPKCMISGIRDSAALAVRAGYKFIQFFDIPERTAQCVDEYLRTLEPLPSPYLVDGRLSDKARAGRKVFEKHGCAECHSGPYYTDMKMHRIGDDIEFEEGWDTPTLCETWRTAPYLFDGRAATMEDVFLVHKHGIEGKISQKDAEALAEYVNSL